jgi:hypothetical protein
MKVKNGKRAAQEKGGPLFSLCMKTEDKFTAGKEE